MSEKISLAEKRCLEYSVLRLTEMKYLTAYMVNMHIPIVKLDIVRKDLLKRFWESIFNSPKLLSRD